MLLQTLKGKGHSITCHRMHREGVKVYLHSFLTSALDWRGWSIPAPGRSPRTCDWVHPRSGRDMRWRTEYLLHTPGFAPWTFQPVASGKQFNVTWFTAANNIFCCFMCRRPCVGVTVRVWRGGFMPKKQPFKTGFPSIMTLQLFRNFSAQITVTNFFNW